MDRSLQDRIALVTGASRGIGRAIAVELARRGAHVFCVSTQAGGCDETVAECTAAGGAATALAADVADEAQVQTLADQVLQGGRRLDVLVNNAGITRDGAFLRMSAEDFDRVLAVNLRGAFLTARAFARSLAKGPHSRIVNVTSVVGLMGNAGQANYAASKAGIVGLTKSLAKEFAGRGVTANAVAPGFIATDMTEALPEAWRTDVLAKIPLGRIGEPRDVAAAVAFLCSEEARYITGQVLVVDGGMCM